MALSRTKLAVALAVSSAILAPQALAAATLEVSGSTTVQKRILEPAAAAIEAATGVKVTVNGNGSGAGFKELMAGDVAASIASSALGLLLKNNGLAADGAYREHVIAEDVIVPIVNAKNPVKSLTWEQLKAINTGALTNWKELGGKDCAIHVVTSHPGSATREVFQKQVMKNAEYAAGAKAVKSTRQEVGRVAKSACAIGAVSKSFVEQDGRNKGKVSIVATDPISRPLSLITKGAPKADVARVIAFLKTPEARALFK